MKILIVGEHASAKFGGEAALPLHYYRILRRRGSDIRMLVHARTRPELIDLLGSDTRIIYIEDTWLDRQLSRAGEFLPSRLATFTTGFLMQCRTQIAQRAVVRKLIAEGEVDIIHQPSPVSPKQPSWMFGFGVPVVIGPMNGGMSFPPAFRKMQGSSVGGILLVMKSLTRIANVMIPGKPKASVLLVANHRTRMALPSRHHNIIQMVENGVDLELWRTRSPAINSDQRASVGFAYMGRLVALKAVDILIDAFVSASAEVNIHLSIIGDGEERRKLELYCAERGVLGGAGETGKIHFFGWLPQCECAEHLSSASVVVLPSLHECGGAVVLEGMAMGIPVIATNWGGPADYLNKDCGILVEPTSREAMVLGFSDAMKSLALDPERRGKLGDAARCRIVEEFDWEKKVDKIVEIYAQCLSDHAGKIR